jgi:hypothetical protein
MSGGYIKPQKTGDHQIVVFTFAGEVKPQHVGKWNDSILALKKHFGPNVMGITMKGHSTPPKLLVSQKKKKK